MFGHPQATGSRTIPGVNDIKTTILEVCNIASSELGSSHLGNGHDLRIRVADRSAERTAVSGNLEKTRAASLSNPKMRPAKSSANIASAAASSPSRRLPFRNQEGRRTT